MYKYVSRKYIFQFIDNLSPEGGSKANSLNVYGMYCNRMSIAEGCVLGLSLIWKGPMNICLKVNQYKDMGILIIKIANGISAVVAYSS